MVCIANSGLTLVIPPTTCYTVNNYCRLLCREEECQWNTFQSTFSWNIILINVGSFSTEVKNCPWLTFNELFREKKLTFGLLNFDQGWFYKKHDTGSKSQRLLMNTKIPANASSQKWLICLQRDMIWLKLQHRQPRLSLWTTQGTQYVSSLWRENQDSKKSLKSS